jgi:hypothetical protein
MFFDIFILCWAKESDSKEYEYLNSLATSTEGKYMEKDYMYFSGITRMIFFRETTQVGKNLKYHRWIYEGVVLGGIPYGFGRMISTKHGSYKSSYSFIGFFYRPLIVPVSSLVSIFITHFCLIEILLHR